jgi:hypothetical protein
VLCLKHLNPFGPLFRYSHDGFTTLKAERRDVEVELFWDAGETMFAAIDLRDSVVSASYINLILVLFILVVRGTVPTRSSGCSSYVKSVHFSQHWLLALEELRFEPAVVAQVLVLSSYIFTKDAEELVVNSIKGIVESVNKMQVTLHARQQLAAKIWLTVGP